MTTENEEAVKKSYSYLAKILGDIFRTHRIKRKISLQKMYKDKKISIAVATDFERGKKFPRVKTLIELFDYINIPIDIMFNPKLFEAPEKFKEINYSNATNNRKRTFQLLDKDDYLKNALMAKGLYRDDMEKVLSYIDFLLYKKDSEKSESNM